MSTSMSTEENNRIVCTYTGEVMTAHKPERASEFVAPDIKRHGGTLGTDKGARNLVGLLQGFIGASPDLQATEHESLAVRSG